LTDNPRHWRVVVLNQEESTEPSAPQKPELALAPALAAFHHIGFQLSIFPTFLCLFPSTGGYNVH
jgi:hypothetical protein